jgi:hypothetical protein
VASGNGFAAGGRQCSHLNIRSRSSLPTIATSGRRQFGQFSLAAVIDTDWLSRLCDRIEPVVVQAISKPRRLGCFLWIRNYKWDAPYGVNEASGFYAKCIDFLFLVTLGRFWNCWARTSLESCPWFDRMSPMGCRRRSVGGTRRPPSQFVHQRRNVARVSALINYGSPHLQPPRAGDPKRASTKLGARFLIGAERRLEAPLRFLQ